MALQTLALSWVSSVTGGQRGSIEARRPVRPRSRAVSTASPTVGPATKRRRAASTGALAVDGTALRNGRRASKVIGSAVYNENNESIGEIDDILIPPGGNAPVAVISVGGRTLADYLRERLEAAGCYGRNCADDVTADAALLARISATSEFKL